MLVADEYKDLAKCELVAVFVQFIYGQIIKKQAVGFLEATDLSVQGISQKAPEVLHLLELDFTLCVSFCFDDASKQKQMKETFPKVIYVHCNSLWLNFLLCTAVKAANIHSF